MRRKANTNNTVRRSKRRFKLGSFFGVFFRYRQFVMVALLIAFPLIAWQQGYIQLAYEKAVRKSHKILASSGFVVQDILVEGREQTDSHQILTAVGIKQGDSIFQCDPDLTKQRLIELPWIKSLAIQRRLPGTIYVRLVERQPVAIWQKSSKLYLIDEQGEVLDGFSNNFLPHLLLVTGEGAPEHTNEFLSILSQYPEIKDIVQAAVFTSGRRWDLILENKVRIKLPEHDLHQAFNQLLKMHKSSQLTSGQVSMIDIRLPDRSFLYVGDENGGKKDQGKIT